MDILRKSVENFDSNAKIDKIFVVDIEFDAYDYPRKKCITKCFLAFSNQKVRYL